MGAKLTYPQHEIPADKTFIVTGGNAGIGYQTAKCIAKLGGRVIIGCRNEEKATKAIEQMQNEHQEEVKREQGAREGTSKPEAQTQPATNGETTDNKEKEETYKGASETDVQPLKVEFMKLDLASFASTMEFVNAYKAKGYPLHVLICNAGLGLVPYQKTDDGLELQFQTNYLSHFLMTIHLLPLLRESAPNSRIINVSSVVHTRGVLDLKNMQGETSYDRVGFYGNSKAYQIMNMYSMTRRLKGSGISVFSVHPGYVDTNFKDGSADSKLYRFVESVSQTLHLKRSMEDGAMTSLVAALDTAYDDKSGIYFKDCKVSTPSSLARNMDKQEQLWDYSVDLLKDHITEDLMEDLTLSKDKNIAPAATVPNTEDAKPNTEEAKPNTEEAKPNKEEAKPNTEAATPNGEAESKSEEKANESEQASEEQSKNNVKTEESAESKSEEPAESKAEEPSESKANECSESKAEELAETKAGEPAEAPVEEPAESKPAESNPEESKANGEVTQDKTESKSESEEAKPTENGDLKSEENEAPSPQVEDGDSKPAEDQAESKPGAEEQ